MNSFGLFSMLNSLCHLYTFVNLKQYAYNCNKQFFVFVLIITVSLGTCGERKLVGPN